MMKREDPYPPGDGTVKWVSTDWLLEKSRDEHLMILDAQPNIHDYIQEHIPGAIYMNEGLLRVPQKGRPGVYTPTEAVQSIFRRLGLRHDVPVAVYTGVGPIKGWSDGLEQTMLAYSLARFGHDAIYVLDGGIDKWKMEKKTLTKEFPKSEESDFNANARKNYFVTYEEFKKIKDDEDVIVLDARPRNIYEGQGPWIKPGHIPDAINLPWASLMDDSNKRLIKSLTAIHEIVDHLEITPDKTIVCSCGTGREATNEFILFKWYLEFPQVKIYEGSFTEWSSYPENPTVVGKNPH